MHGEQTGERDPSVLLRWRGVAETGVVGRVAGEEAAVQRAEVEGSAIEGGSDGGGCGDDGEGGDGGGVRWSGGEEGVRGSVGEVALVFDPGHGAEVFLVAVVLVGLCFWGCEGYNGF